MRAIVRARKIDEGYRGTEIQISVRAHADHWAHEFMAEMPEHIAGQIRRVTRLRVGESVSVAVTLEPWSHKYWTDCGYEYDAGVYVLKCKTLKASKRRPATP